MISNDPLMIAVAPNGARKTKRDHPQLPISPRELANTAAACLDGGACLLHLHVRDEDFQHTLDVARYRAAIEAIRAEVGEELIIQVTSEAVGSYTREQQIRAIRELRPEAVSLAIRELSPVDCDENVSAEFFAYLHRERIAAQYILYDASDIQHFDSLLKRGIIPDENLSVLLVLGRYADNQQSKPQEISALVSRLPDLRNWFLCAFGASELECMSQTMESGGHCRVGFENNMLAADGSIAIDNAALVTAVSRTALDAGRRVATPAEARVLLGMR